MVKKVKAMLPKRRVAKDEPPPPTHKGKHLYLASRYRDRHLILICGYELTCYFGKNVLLSLPLSR